MRLLRFGEPGTEKPGLLDADGNIRDLSAHIEDVTGAVLDDGSLARLRAIGPASLPLVAGNPRIGPCVGNIGKFMCIGLNYSDHAAETGARPPDHPILFMKATSAVVGPNDTVVACHAFLEFLSPGSGTVQNVILLRGGAFRTFLRDL